MKYRILYDFRTFIPFEEKSYSSVKDLHKPKLLTNFDANLTSSPGGARNLTFNTLFITPPGN